MHSRPNLHAILFVIAGMALLQSDLGRAEEADAGTATEELTARDWAARLREWRPAIVTDQRDEGDASRQAKENIRSIADPNAAPAIEAALKREKHPIVRLLYYEALANIPTDASLEILVRASVTESGEYLRTNVARLMSKMPNLKDGIPLYVRFLRSRQFAGYAAEAVSHNGITSQHSPGEQLDRDLVNGLINALVGTKIQGRMVYQWAAWQWHNGKGGVDTAVRGSRRPYYTAIPVPNTKALRSIQEYTGQDYGYDQNAWKRWYESSNGPTN